MISSLTNLSASVVSAKLALQTKELEKSQERLSSGCKISTAADDAGGLAIASKLAAQVRVLDVYESVLTGASSFLDMQSAALQQVAAVLQRLEELKTLKLDPTKTPSDLALYDIEIADLNGELVKIGEEKYNGIRLFSPGVREDFLTLDTFALDGGSLPLVRPPLKGSTSTEVFPNPLDVVFLIDLTGSMGGTIAQLKTTIGNFFSNLPSSVNNWRARIVGYRDEFFESPPAFVEVGDFVSTVPDVLSQLNDPAIFADGGEDDPETLEDALYKVSKYSNWSSSVDVKRMVIAFTDADPKEPPKVAGRSDIIKELRAADIDLTICGSSDPTTKNFTEDSGAAFEDYDDVLGDMSGFLAKFAKRANVKTVLTKGLTLEETAAYLARKGAEASVLTVLKQQRSYIRNNLESAVSKIRDTDVAAEMSSMIRHKILVDSGAAMLKKATDSMKVILTLLNSSNIK